MDRLTVRKKMEGLPFEEGKHGSKDYDSATALRALYLGKGEDGEVAVSGQEAQRLLAVSEIDQSLARLNIWRALLAVAVAGGDLTPFLEKVR